jgi:hypothetical protein
MEVNANGQAKNAERYEKTGLLLLHPIKTGPALIPWASYIVLADVSNGQSFYYSHYTPIFVLDSLPPTGGDYAHSFLRQDREGRPSILVRKPKSGCKNGGRTKLN